MTVTPGRKNASFFSRPVLYIAAVYCLPVLLPALSGLLLGVLAVPVAYLLLIEGADQGIITLRNSLLLTGGVAFLSGRFEIFLFVLTLLPLGYCLYLNGSHKKDEAATGGYGVLTLGGGWLVFWILYGILSGTHPYQQLVTMLDSGFVAAYEMYKTSSEISAEMQKDLAAVIFELRALVPVILPGLLACTVLITVWMNQLVWNSLLLHIYPDKAPWPPYSRWKLPEQLVWLPIVATMLLLLGGGRLKDIALNVLLITGVVYFFQGLAVFIHLLARWNVPRYFRILLYLMLIIQSYGLILVSLLGVADIWFNLRPVLDNAGTAGKE